MDHRTEPTADGGDDARGEERPTKSNFLRDMVDADLAAGRHSKVVTRFPPEPNGFMHIGHAKAIRDNYGIAQHFGGLFRLRFDDTNPLTEETRYVEAIERDIAWLGCEWEAPTRHASDYFDYMYSAAITLVRKGLAYVDDQSKEAISEGRGTVTEAGKNSPYRDRQVAENLDLLARMKAGEFPDGSRVLRAKIDMSSPNMLLRDPLIYRIRHAHHHRTGDAWCIYPLYDFAHCLEDACEGVTHSLCSLEFETRRPLYDWVLDNVLEGDELAHRPHQYEFGRTGLEYTVTSKRKLLRLVTEGHVDGWDDPRMPTIAGLRRRGVTPEAISEFCDLIGISRNNRTVDIGKLEYSLREDLNHRCPRVLCVLDPLEVVITTWAPERVDEIDASYWPRDIPKHGTRALPLTRRIFIERDDFDERPPKGWHRLAPGGVARLRHACVVQVDEVEKDADGNVVRLLCSHSTATGHVMNGKRAKGTIHWVSAERSIPCEVRLYDRLFSVPEPGKDRDLIEDLNPDALTVMPNARIEESVAADPPGTRYQFERRGYFIADERDSAPHALVFNRTVTLRDTWGNLQGKIDGSSDEDAVLHDVKKAPVSQQEGPRTTIGDERVRARADNLVLATAYGRYTTELGLNAEDADRLTGDEALVAFVDAALGACPDAQAVSKWTVNELLRELKDRSPSDLPFDGATFGRFVALAESDAITGSAAKDVFAAMITAGGEAEAIVDARGLRQVKDADALGAIVDEVLTAHPDHVARYREGKTSLLGFFMGQVMKASKGKASPGLVQPLIAERLGEVSSS